MNATKVCPRCLVDKPLDSFGGRKDRPAEYRTECKCCHVLRQQVYVEANRDFVNTQQAARRARVRDSVKYKAGVVLNSMRGKSKAMGWPEPEFTRDEVEEAIRYGKCCRTGLSFDFGKTKFSRNPWAPSPDRINPAIGYTKDNVQWVVMIYNYCKLDFDQEVISRFVNALREHYKENI